MFSGPAAKAVGPFWFLAVSEESLTGKRQQFVDAYVGEANCNATRAAEIAGYASPRVEGSRLLKDPKVKAAVAERLREWALSQEEILARLSEQARGDMADFLAVDEEGGFRIDLAQAKRNGKLRLVRKIGYDQKGRPSIELYDGQSALLALGKRYHLFSERVELTGADGGPVRIGISYEEALAALKAPEAHHGEIPTLRSGQAPTGREPEEPEELSGVVGL